MPERINKKTLKELKEPDFLQVELIKLTEFANLHKAKILICAVILGCCLLLTGGWFLYQMNYEKSAFQLYSQAEAVAAKNSPGPTVIAAYQDVTTKYARSQATLQAYHQLGNIYLGLNQIDLSLQMYGELLKKASRNNYLKYFAYSGQGYGYEAKNDYKNALAAFEQALKMPEATYLAGQVYRDMARVYEQMKEQQKSLEYYRKSLEKTTDNTTQMILKRKIASLS